MIKLEVQPYCENCSIFEADVESPDKYYSGNDLIYQTDTIVRCSHRNLCAGLKKYLEKEMLKGEKK